MRSADRNKIGFEGVDAGHLDASRNIENLGLLVGQLRAYVAS
jgi:predicted dinucleotide-binding enzyme